MSPKPNPQDIPCGLNDDGTEAQMVTFEDSVQKIHGVYWQMDRVMCQTCYNAVRHCRKGVIQTGAAVDRKTFKAWQAKIIELARIQKQLETEQHIAELKKGKVG